MDSLDPCAPQRVCTSCANHLMLFQSELKMTISAAAQEMQVDAVSMDRYMHISGLCHCVR